MNRARNLALSGSCATSAQDFSLSKPTVAVSRVSLKPGRRMCRRIDGKGNRMSCSSVAPLGTLIPDILTLSGLSWLYEAMTLVLHKLWRRCSFLRPGSCGLASHIMVTPVSILRALPQVPKRSILFTEGKKPKWGKWIDRSIDWEADREIHI